MIKNKRSRRSEAAVTELKRYYPALPDNLKVGGYLDLRGTQITALPDNLKVGGDLDLSGTQITALPDNLKVGGYLDLSGTQITALPDNLKVGGSLYLSGTQITALPDNLKVGGYLDLSGTQITALPDNLKVGGYLYLSGCKKISSGKNWIISGEIGSRNDITSYNVGEDIIRCGCFKDSLAKFTKAVHARHIDGVKYRIQYDAFIALCKKASAAKNRRKNFA